MHRGKVDPGVGELPRGKELSRDHVNRPLGPVHMNPGQRTTPGQALHRVHMMICCPGTTLPRINFIAPGQVQRYLITTNLSEFLYFYTNFNKE